MRALFGIDQIKKEYMPTVFRVLALVLILGIAGKVSAQVADPAPDPVLAYEGRLVVSGTPVTGVQPFIFSIVDSTGTELWNSGPQSLIVTGGLYGVVLGAAGMPVIPASPRSTSTGSLCPHHLTGRCFSVMMTCCLRRSCIAWRSLASRSSWHGMAAAGLLRSAPVTVLQSAEGQASQWPLVRV